MSTLRIGEVASRTGFSRDAIRYYERLGLLGHPLRTAAGYRVYGEQSLKRLRVIRNAKRFGFSLSEIRAFMKVRDAGGAPCVQVRKAAERRLQEVDEQLRELSRVRLTMRRTLEQWDAKLAATPAGARAGLLEDDVDLPAKAYRDSTRTIVQPLFSRDSSKDHARNSTRSERAALGTNAARPLHLAVARPPSNSSTPQDWKSKRWDRS